MRKYAFILILFFAFTNMLSAQNKLSNYLSADEKTVTDVIRNPIKGATGRSVSMEVSREIEGSPFFKDEWMSADVIINKVWYGDVDAKLSLFSGNVHVKTDSNNLVVNVPVDELWLYGPDSLNGEKYIFRTGYFTEPTLNNTFLQVLTDGKYQFLKFRQAITEEYPVPFENSRLRYAFTDTYYIYEQQQGLKKIKLSKESVIAAVPEAYASKMQKLISDKKTKFKSEASVAELMDAFNKELTK